MLNKLLLWLFSRRFKRLSTDEQKRVRELVNNENATAQRENKKETKKRRTKKMADEKEVKTKEETEKTVETKKDESSNDKVEETKKVDESEKEVDKKDDKPADEDKKEEPAKEEEQVDNQVEEIGSSMEGITVDQLVTKDYLKEVIGAFQAKLDSVSKENEDLKEELAKKNDELNGMKDKYENPDFGNSQKKGVQVEQKLTGGNLYERYVRGEH